MDEKLARGHATAYINSLQDFGQILDWVKGPRRRKAMATFDRSSFYKKPGRVLNRLAPILRPQFQRSKIDQWTRQHKGISAIGLASSAENRLFRLPDNTRPLYSERAVFMVDLLLAQHHDKTGVYGMMGSSISKHAIARLVEREGTSPATLSEDIVLLLGNCAGIAERILDTAFDHSTMMSFMVPFGDGALRAVLMEVDPAQTYMNLGSGHVLSVRTYLDPGKLSDLDMERMFGPDWFNAFMMGDYDAIREHFFRGIEGNARPWQFSDRTLEDQG